MKKLLVVLLVLVYSCTTTNDGNTTRTSVVPLPPTNLVGTVGSSTTVNLSWIDNSTNETGFKIERKVSGGDYTLISTTDADKSTYSDSDLSLGMTYTYRVYAYNAVGKSLTYAYSLDIKTGNVPVLTTTLATLTFGGGASSGGNITDNGSSDITARGVVWSTNSTPTINLPTKTVDGSGNGVFTSVISGLTTGTTYYVRAYATNSIGTAYGNQISFTESAVPSSGLVGYWPFNGNANDVSGSENNGTVNGSTLTTDRFGNVNSAYSFNGTSDYIRINNTTNLNNPSVSVSGWFYTNTNATDTFYGAKSIIGKYWDTPSNCNSNYNSYIFCLALQRNNSTVCLGTSFYSGNAFYYDKPINIGNWYHFTFVHDSSSGGRIYINGQLVASNTISGSICNGTNPLYIGADSRSGNLFRFFNGKIDDIGLWNRALTQAEITALYNSTGK